MRIWKSILLVVFWSHVIADSDVLQPAVTVNKSATGTNKYHRSGQDNNNEKDSHCPKRPTDLVFLLDASYSVTALVFMQDVLPFVQSVTRIFEIAPDKTRVGVIQYSHIVKVEFHLNAHINRDSLERAIANIPYLGGATLTGKAIDFMSRFAFSEQNGSRPLNAGVNRVAIVITDGHSYDTVLQAANGARDNGIFIYAVGVTEEIDDKQLEEISGDKANYVSVNSFKDLDEKLRAKIEVQICVNDKKTKPKIPAPAIVPPSTTDAAPTTTAQILLDPADMPKQAQCDPDPAKVYHILHRTSELLVGVPTAGQADGESVALLPRHDKGPHIRVQFEAVAGRANTYQITFAHSKKDFDIHQGLVDKSDRIVQQSNVEAENQYFFIDVAADGWCTIKSTQSNRYLTVETDDVGSNVIQGDPKPTTESHFRFLALKHPPSNLTIDSPCSQLALDLIFLIDGSGSVTESVFTEDVLPFVQSVSKLFEIGPDKTRIGVVQYSHRIRVEFHLNIHKDQNSLEEAIANITYLSGGTRTGQAIEFVTLYGFSEQNGSRPLTSATHRIAIVITDGQSYDEVLRPSNDARESGISLYAIGVTDSVDEAQLEAIGGEKSHYFSVKSFTDLDTKLKDHLESQLCPRASSSSAPEAAPQAPAASLIPTNKPCVPRANQAYRIGHRSSHLVLGIPNAGTADGELVKLVPNSENGPHAQVQFKPVLGRSDLYHIVFMHSKKEFRTSSKSDSEVEPVVQYTSTEAPNQHFGIDETDDGWCMLKAAHTFRYLKAKTNNVGSEIVEETSSGIDAHFRLVPAKPVAQILKPDSLEPDSEQLDSTQSDSSIADSSQREPTTPPEEIEMSSGSDAFELACSQLETPYDDPDAIEPRSMLRDPTLIDLSIPDPSQADSTDPVQTGPCKPCPYQVYHIVHGVSRLTVGVPLASKRDSEPVKLVPNGSSADGTRVIFKETRAENVYQIFVAHSNMTLNVRKISREKNAPVVQNIFGEDGSLFHIEESSSGWCTIRSDISNRYLLPVSDKKNQYTAGSLIVQGDKMPSCNGYFRFESQGYITSDESDVVVQYK